MSEVFADEPLTPRDELWVAALKRTPGGDQQITIGRQQGERADPDWMVLTNVAAPVARRRAESLAATFGVHVDYLPSFEELERQEALASV